MLAAPAEQQLAETRRELEYLGVYIAALVEQLGTTAGERSS
jgi:hypothetical protein